jgi:GGDEF domain-containing protein
MITADNYTRETEMGKQSKNGKTETSSVGAVIAAICIVIYLGALVQAAVRFYLSVDQRRITAENEFDVIVDLALIDGRRGFMDEQFKETMNNALAESKSIEALIISGPDNEYVFERQKGYAVNWVNGLPRFIDRWGFSNKNYYKPLQINDLRNVNIKAVARAFDYYDVSKILKETLLIILIGFSLSFFAMLLQLLAGTGPGKPNEKTDTADAEAPDTADLRDDIEIEDTQSGPKGLYSARSNIGWEEYIKDRLDSELHRCSSTEKDLSLMYMDFTGITGDIMYRQAAEEAVAFFTSRDLLFEYGKYGICAILTGISLETGISKAEKFYQRISQKFPGGKNASGLRIGISSRSGRLLNADRLMMEAAEALNRAKKDPKSPITAFKSNLDRYRAFIASQSQKAQ